MSRFLCSCQTVQSAQLKFFKFFSAAQNKQQLKNKHSLAKHMAGLPLLKKNFLGDGLKK